MHMCVYCSFAEKSYRILKSLACCAGKDSTETPTKEETNITNRSDLQNNLSVSLSIEQMKLLHSFKIDM